MPPSVTALPHRLPIDPSGPTPLFTRAQIAQTASASLRQIDYWTSVNLIQPDKSEHRGVLYDSVEVLCATITARLFAWGLTSNNCREVLTLIRTHMQANTQAPHTLLISQDGVSVPDSMGQVLDAFATGRALIILPLKAISEQVQESLLNLHRSLDTACPTAKPQLLTA